MAEIGSGGGLSPDQLAASLAPLNARLVIMEATGADYAAFKTSTSAAIPQPATTAPPSVADTSAKGTVPRYALEDHTHRSSMQAQRMTAALVSGKFTWTFPVPYAAGDVPVVNATAESPEPSGGYVLDARVVAGSVTNAGCQIMVNRIATSQTLGGTLLAIAGTVIGIVTPATGTAVVHCWARKP